ncbi:MAG: endonuclease/exonuclease/phosphatase family protein [Paracoccus sp. (in: a-proteobacteria)]|nr:endonuclease/exonuclease/phosphatase family protein [Paracoccus sp. (in: a-proteobacteria)]
MGLKTGLLLAWLLAAAPAAADSIRIASYDPNLTRKGPGLLLRDIQAGRDGQIAAVIAVIAAADADVLLLTGFDWDHDGQALGAFVQALASAGVDYPHRFAGQPNRGIPTGIDMDGDGRLNRAEDMQGWARFTGQNGLAVLSRLPIGTVTDYSHQLWRDQPGHLIADAIPPEAAAVQRLSTTAHWDVQLQTDPPLHLLAWSATPPVFDGPEDRNGRRNHDENIFWLRHLPDAPFVLAGNANLDPIDGEGRHEAIRAILSDPRLQDPRPKSEGARLAADPDHRGDPALDTADWPDGKPGNLRVTYVLPSAGLRVTGSGTLWPAPDTALADQAAQASPHRLVWVDLVIGDQVAEQRGR